MKRILQLIICVLCFGNATGQAEVVQVQPTIMVIPFVKTGQDIRTIIEEDFNKRMAISAVKEAFGERGFVTKDFAATLKIALKERALGSDHKTDLKSEVVRMSGAEFFVEVEIVVQKSSTGNAVKIILQGYDSFTGNSLANKSGESGKFYTDDIAKLSKKATESISEEFLNSLNDKFADIRKNGRSVRINIVFDENSEYNMDSEIGPDGDLLSDFLEDWMEDNSYKNYFHIESITENQFVVDDYRIPLRDDNGNNYRATKTMRYLRNYIRKELGLTVKTDLEGMGKINIIIQ